MDPKCQSSSPQKQTMKNRSKSTDEVQQAKKAFHTPQKSLPGKTELEKLKETSEVLETSSSTEELTGAEEN
ncbi:sodium-dependent phosphate transport protein 2A-like [Acipenser oxyrinchus oxyrinchus]|uniref:Sodium-dependent phosphate transport protein 2A-like n=1 Tax=Acipenser oxyrinchus oxyrinchus TaxID=40147 RepID=A0AAD8D271_ACIOX|nr:sodium-dependent phosphate transport protein 2A-like [Acipenser oxyrinchus oxyrinchus]